MKAFFFRHGRGLLVMALIVLAVSFFHARGLRPGFTFLPVDLAQANAPWRIMPPDRLQNALISDPLYQFYPFLTFTVSSLKTYTWPLWNPYILMGHPSFADPLAQTFYPAFAALGLLLGSARAIAIGLWLHALLAAGLTYGFLRALRCSRSAALLGALTYALSGYLVTWFETLFWTSTLAWLPGALWGLELAIQRRRLVYVGLAGLALGLAMLAGQMQFVLIFSLFLGSYAILRAIESRGEGKRAVVWPVLAAAMVVGLGALIGAVQTLPFGEFVGLSQRIPGFKPESVLPLWHLITLIVPDLFGNPASLGEYWGKINYSEAVIYAGVVTLLLACLAPFVARQRRILAIGLAGVTAVLAYLLIGGPGSVWLASMPPFNYLGFNRVAVLLPLVLAILAALTFDAPPASRFAPWIASGVLAGLVGLVFWQDWQGIRAHVQQLRPSLLQAAFLLLAASTSLVLAWHRPRLRPLMAGILVLLSFVDLYLVGSRYNPVGPIDSLPPPTPAIEYLQANAGAYRVAPLAGGGPIVVGPNVSSVFGLSEGGGYSSLVPFYLHLLFEVGDPTGKHWNVLMLGQPSLNLVDLLQVRYTIGNRPLADVGLRPEVVADGCRGDSVEITSGEPVTGTFQIRNGPINRMDMKFRVLNSDQTAGALVVRLWEGVDRRRQVLDARIDTETLHDKQVVSWNFAPERDAVGKTYLWEVMTDPATAPTGVALCRQANGVAAVSAYGSQWSEVYSGEATIHERQAPLPRAYVVYAAQPEGDRRVTAHQIMDESFDLRRIAVISKKVRLPATKQRLITPATIVDYQPGRVVVQAVAEQEGLLVLGDSFYPGWEAKVDGQPSEVLRVNFIQRGVLVPAGEHRVEFTFRSAMLRTGAWLSLLGVVVLVGLVVADRAMARRRFDSYQ